MSRWILSCDELDPVNCGTAAVQWMDYYAFDPLGITPTDVLYVFSWGFGVILAFWALGYGAGCMISAIRKM